ncbi:type I-D CRISPR-associated protein Csc1 [Acidianus sulfidivorans JP7]|uniref:Type I-D CRISPR-associated protein Csc1 n=1 Tax=Acidianus sulfidivorans JP7 TaxID=619593 RepID=A0A2U9IQ64_9CREN|nr:type I-D CRISPR-associated protein Csc1 [Acidianus sulfidivorans]AWR98126.1 type I-D CRISPR-associated protein Csc1 [Acidianus sulfidivorans JP7]
MLLKVTYRLEGILIFSTEVRPAIIHDHPLGSYIAPSPHIHNYPILYALAGKPTEAYFVIPSLHEGYFVERGLKKSSTLNYTTIKQILDNAKKGIGFYAYPLMPKKIITSSFLFTSEAWGYGLIRRKTKNVFPRLTSYTTFMIGSEFESYLLTDGKYEIPDWIRIGKKRWGIMRLYLEKPNIREIKEESQCLTSIPINVKDAEYFGYKVIEYTKLLETPSLEEGIVGWAKLNKCYTIVIDNERLTIPVPSEEFLK